MQTLKTHIPACHLRTFQFVAAHFGTTPEAIMQCEVLAQIRTLKDSPFRMLKYFEAYDFSEPAIPQISLALVPSAYNVVELVAQTLRRSVSELAGVLLCSCAQTLACEVEDALRTDGLNSNPQLCDWAMEWMKFEFETRKGTMPIDGNGLDYWDHLELEPWKPAAVHRAPRKPAPKIIKFPNIKCLS
jgi:hypothetical protein